MSMELQDFCGILEDAVQEGWRPYLDDDEFVKRCIRLSPPAGLTCQYDTYCPLTCAARHLHGYEHGMGSYYHAGDNLCMDVNGYMTIMHASDNEATHHASTRAAILRACGLGGDA